MGKCRFLLAGCFCILEQICCIDVTYVRRWMSRRQIAPIALWTFVCKIVQLFPSLESILESIANRGHQSEFFGSRTGLVSPQYFSPNGSLCALHMICRWNVIFERDVATISHLLQLFFTPLFTGKIVASLLPKYRAHYVGDAPEASASRVFSLFRIVSLSFLRSRSAFFIANIRFFPVSIILGGKKIRFKKHPAFKKDISVYY